MKGKKFAENRLSGDIGECIIKFLIESMNEWECIPYGVEHHIRSLKNLVTANHLDDASVKVKSMPDFVAVDKNSKAIYFIEVKTRTTPFLYGFRYQQIQEYVKFWKEAKLIFIYPFHPYFSVIDVKDIKIPEHYRGKEDNFYCWKFEGIQKDIKSLFPNLSKESIDQAIKMIPTPSKINIK